MQDITKNENCLHRKQENKQNTIQTLKRKASTVTTQQCGKRRKKEPSQCFTYIRHNKSDNNGEPDDEGVPAGLEGHVLEGGEPNPRDEREHEHEARTQHGEWDGGEGSTELAAGPRQQHQHPAHLDHAAAGYLGTTLKVG